MYAYRDAYIDALPYALVGLDDASLVAHGIYHVREMVPDSYDRDRHNLVRPAPTTLGYDDTGPIPVVTMVWDLVEVSEDETAARIAAREAEAKRLHNAPILARLAEIDAATVRPLRAVLAAQAAGTDPDPADIARLAALEAQAAEARAGLM